MLQVWTGVELQNTSENVDITCCRDLSFFLVDALDEDYDCNVKQMNDFL